MYKMHIANNPPFAFRLRRERIDWKLLASVDVDKVARDVDFQTLQDNTANVTFCDIQAEVDPFSMDQNFIKLFRIAQLIIEYLIYSQDCLSSALASSELESSALTKQVTELGEKLKKQKSRKKNIDGNPPFVIVDDRNQCKCGYCPKMFFNQTYLRLHHERRHPDQPLITPADPISTNPATLIDMDAELKAIKDRLKLTEDHLKEEKAALDNDAVKIQNHTIAKEAELRQEMETWKAEQLNAHKQELENTKDLFKKELDILQEKYLMSERQLNELQRNAVPVIAEPKVNPAVLIAEGKETTELMKKQQLEIMEMKELLKQQVLNMGKNMQQQLKEQEDHWESKVSQMEGKYHEEIRKLKEPLYSKKMDSEQELDLPDMELSLNRQIKELEKLNITQKNTVEKKKRSSQRKKNKTHIKIQSTDNEDSIPKAQDLDIMGEINYRNDQSLTSSHFGYSNALKLHDESIRRNPIIIQGMRDEVSHLLDDKLELMGIKKNTEGVKESDLKRTMTNRLNGSQERTQKYTNLKYLREQLQLQVDKIAQLKLIEHRRPSSSPAKAKKSLRKILNSVKERVTLVHSRSRSPSPVVPPREINLSPLKTSHEDSVGDTLDRGLYNKIQNVQITNKSSEEIEDEDISITDTESSSDSEASLEPSPSGKVGVPDLARSLEKQFESRKGKPAGGVNVFPMDHFKQVDLVSTKDKSTSNFWHQPNKFTSTPDASKNKPPPFTKVEKDNSTSVAANNVDGSKLSRETDTQKKRDGEVTISPFDSLSSWDSDNEISEIS